MKIALEIANLQTIFIVIIIILEDLLLLAKAQTNIPKRQNNQSKLKYH